MSRGCLRRRAVVLIAGGRLPKERLPDVERHLRSCPRCRAQVVRAAEGRLGDTLEDEPRRRGWACVLPVAASLVAVALTLHLDEHHTPPTVATPPELTPVAALEVSAPSPVESLVRSGSMASR